MNVTAALDRAREVIQAAGYDPNAYHPNNFLEYGPFVVDIIKFKWTTRQRENCPWLFEFLESWRAIYDKFDDLVRADPMMLYRPAHEVSLAFHKSTAFNRYYRAGNRTSKSQSGYAEHYLVTTGQHKWRAFPAPPHLTFIVGYDFNKYGPSVFEPKFLSGEKGNALSPMFPDGGKWFYYYDRKSHTIYLACRQCAENGTAQACPKSHVKSEIRLYSDERGWENLQGFSGTLGHFDEHIKNKRTYTEAMQRLDKPYSCFILTGTPLHGTGSWETQLLGDVAEGLPEKNLANPKDPDSQKLVEIFCIDQYAAGLVPKDKIDAKRQMMDEFEIDARIYGNPAPLADRPVFDRKVLAAMRKECASPVRGDLQIVPNDKNLGTVENVCFPSDVHYAERVEGPLRVWSKPEEKANYVISVDTAAGLDPGGVGRTADYSCATVFRVVQRVANQGAIDLQADIEQVAQWHGWIPLSEYADEVKKLAVWYNAAVVVIELTGGYGTAVMQRLRRQILYWNVFRAENRAEQFTPGMEHRFGLETNSSTKPMMVGNAQALLLSGHLKLRCTDTIREMVAFTQETSESGLTNRFRGAGEKDDRTMSVVMAAHIAVSYNLDAYFGGIGPEVVHHDEDDVWAVVHKEIADKEYANKNGFF